MSGKNATKTIVFDLETLPNLDIIPYLPEIEADTRLTDPAKIQANIKMKEQKRNAELGLDPATCRICCFGWCDDGETNAIMIQENSDRTERKLLQQMWEVLNEFNQFVGFNSMNFDLPIMLFRSMKHKVRPSVKISRKRYTHDNHCDIRMELGQWDKYCKGTLDYFSKVLLGKGVKDEISGDMVNDLFEAELYEEISQYCQQDTLITWELYGLLKKFYLL